MKWEGSNGTSRGATARAPRSWWRMAGLAGFALASAALVYFLIPGPDANPPVGAPGAPGSSPEAGATPELPAEEEPLLEIGREEWSWERREDEVVVAGTVRNVSGGVLRNVVAEVSFFGADGAFLRSVEAFVLPREIPAGEAVGFEVRAAWDPAMRDARVGFQGPYGDRIATRWK